MQEYAEKLGSAGVMLLCVSRHPYDIAGMSTGRAWPSCHTLGGDTPKDKARKRAKYAKEMEEYKNELAELGLDEQKISALLEYSRELGAYRKKKAQLVDAVNKALRYYDQARADAHSVLYRLDRLVDEIVNSINAGQRKIIADSVSKNTGIPETIAKDAVAFAMDDEDDIYDRIRYKLVVNALPNITPKQRNFFDINERKGTSLESFSIFITYLK